MKRTLKQMLCLLLSLTLGLELLPLRVLAATADEMLRFKKDMTSDCVVITAEYDGRAYIMGGSRDAGGRTALAADGSFTAVSDPGTDWENRSAYVEIWSGKGPSLFQIGSGTDYFTFGIQEMGGCWLKLSGGALTVTEIGEAPVYWKSGYSDAEDQWVSALGIDGEGYLALHVGDGEPYFTAAASLGEHDLPCQLAAREACSHYGGMTHHEAVPATCTREGVAAYWTCSLCEAAGRNFRFLDSNGAIPFWDDASLTVPAEGHRDGDGDDVCDVCEKPMPVFTRVTMPSEIRAGLDYLLATEIDSQIWLMAPQGGAEPIKDGKGGKEDETPPTDLSLLPAAWVPTDGDGAIRYADMLNSGALLLRLSDAAPDENLDDGEYSYTVTAVGGAQGVLENMWGDWRFTADHQSKYGWRIRLNEDGSVRFMPVEPMSPEQFDCLRAYGTESGTGFSILSTDEAANRYGSWDEETEAMRPPASYPVYLYMMSGQDVERYDYTLSEAPAVIDYENAAEQEGFDAAAVARCAVNGVRDAVTDKTVRDCIDALREETGSVATHYTVTAYAALTAVYQPPADAELMLKIYLKLHVSGDGEEYEDDYYLERDQLASDMILDFVIYSPFAPQQLTLHVKDGVFDGDVTYRSTSDPLQENLARPFAAVDDSAYLLGFRTTAGEYPISVAVRRTAVLEEHAHEWGALQWDAENEWRVCAVCGERGELTPHSYARFEENSYASWNVNHVRYAIDPTEESPGTQEVRCSNPLCGYVKESAIDPEDNWHWLVLRDEHGDPIPPEYIQNVCWWQNNVLYQDISSQRTGYGSITGLDPNFHYAWHYPQHIVGEHLFYNSVNDWDKDGSIKLTVTFTNEGRLKYIVPWTLTFDELVPGEPAVATIRSREGKTLTVTGRFPRTTAESGQTLGGTIHTLLRKEDLSGDILEEESLWKDIDVARDGSFTVSMPYGPTELRLSAGQWGELIYHNVQTMECSEEGVVDLGEVDIRNRNGYTGFYTRWYSEAEDGAAVMDALNSLRGTNKFILTNDDTGEVVTDVSVAMPEDPAEHNGSARLHLSAPHSFEVGSHLTLSYPVGTADEIAVEPVSFVLAEVGEEVEPLELTLYRRGRVRLDPTGYSPDWRALFDGEGNLISQVCGTLREEAREQDGAMVYDWYYDVGYLDEGDYTLFLYQKNSNIGGVTAVDEMDRLEVPEKFYTKVAFTVGRGETVTLTPEVPPFNPAPEVVMTATCENSLRMDDAVPVTIQYRVFVPFGEKELTLSVFGRQATDSSAALPLVKPDGERYAAMVGGGTLRETVKLTDGGYHYEYLELVTGKAHNAEGTIRVYAKPDAGTIYVRCGDEPPVSVSIPVTNVTVQQPFAVTSALEGKFVYYATLPKSGEPYHAAVYVNGRRYEQDGKVSLSGRGANEIPYRLTELDESRLSGSCSAQLHAEITHTVTDPETGETSEEQVWRSDEYPVTWYDGGWPEPDTLRVRVSLNGQQRGGKVFDFNKSDGRMMMVTYYPRDFNSDYTINQEMTVDFQLTLKENRIMRDGTVLLQAYCNDTTPEPTIRTAELKYNEYYNTFDGTIVYDANSATISDLPYGYSFVYNLDREPELEPGMETVAEQIEARADELAERFTDERIEPVDMDELEDLLTNSAELSETEKNMIRIFASYQNEMSDIQREYLDGVMQIELTEGVTIGDVTPRNDSALNETLLPLLTVMNRLGGDGRELRAERLGENVTEDALTELGYTAADGGEGGTLYLRHDAETGISSVVAWRERLHVWRGGESPLSGAPLAAALTADESGAAMTAFSVLLLADSYDRYDPDIAVFTDTFQSFSTGFVLISRILNDLLGNIVKSMERVTRLQDRLRQLQAENARLNAAAAQNKTAQQNTQDALHKLQAEMRAQKRVTKTIGAEIELTKIINTPMNHAELSALMREMSALRKELAQLGAAIQQGVKEMSLIKVTDTDFRPALKKLEWLKGPKVSGLLRKIGIGASLLGIVGDTISMLEASNTAKVEASNAQLEIKCAWGKYAAMREAACSSSHLVQQAKCFDAYKEFAEQQTDISDWYAWKAIYKIGMLGPSILTGIASAFCPENLYIQLADLTLWSANNVNDAVALASVCINIVQAKRAGAAVEKQCVDPLPFPNCEHQEEEPEAPQTKKPPEVPAPAGPVIDPSGYAYEAVASNRVEGVTAAIYYRDGEDAVAWEDAPLYDQIREQTTGADGRYEWMTPPGEWRVTLSKEGYLDADSSGDPAANEDGWLPVPPPQMNVNIPMVSTSAPTVRSVSVASDRVRVTFSQYMEEDAADAVTVTKDGAPVSVTAAFVDREESPTREGVYFGRVLELAGAFSGEGYAVHVSGDARNYAGRALESGYDSGTLSVTQAVGALSHAYPNRFVTDLGDTEELVVTVKDTDGRPMAGAPVSVTQETGGMLRFASDTVSSDAEGRAVFAATGVAAGYDALTFASDAVSVQMNTRVKPLGTESPKKPAANLSDGQTVEAGTALVLECATEDSVIYYTTDNTCPCSESESRKIYAEPIPVTETTLFRIAAYTEAGGYSERLNLRVLVEGGEPETPAPTVERSGNGLTISDMPEGVDAVAAFYGASGQMLRVETVADGGVTWTDEPDDVRAFFVDPGWKPLYPAWSWSRSEG